MEMTRDERGKYSRAPYRTRFRLRLIICSEWLVHSCGSLVLETTSWVKSRAPCKCHQVSRMLPVANHNSSHDIVPNPQRWFGNSQVYSLHPTIQYDLGACPYGVPLQLPAYPRWALLGALKTRCLRAAEGASYAVGVPCTYRNKSISEGYPQSDLATDLRSSMRMVSIVKSRFHCTRHGNFVLST